MATITIKNGDLVSSGGTVENEIEVEDSNFLLSRPVATAFITVVSGTIQFGAGGDAITDQQAWTAGQVAPIPFRPGYKNVRFKKASAGDSFVFNAI